MRYIETLLIALLFTMAMPLSQATNGYTTMVYTQKQVDSIMAEEIQKAVEVEVARQVDTELLGYRIDKVANEKLDRLQAEHDAVISQHFAIMGFLITILAALIGVFIPILLNRKAEQRLIFIEKMYKNSQRELIKNKTEFQDGMEEMRNQMEIIRDEVVGLKQEAQASKDIAEKAAHQSLFSERITQALNEKDFDKQIELYSQLIKDFPEKELASQTYYAIGKCYLNNRNYDKAIENLAEAITRNPDFVDAYYNRGKAYSYVNDSTNALEDFRECIRLNQYYVKAYEGKCVVYRHLGQLNDARVEAYLGLAIAKKLKWQVYIERFENVINEIDTEIDKKESHVE